MLFQFEEAATKDDLLGAAETSNRGFFSKSSLKQKNTVFTIGNRGEILNSQLEAPIIIPHSAQQNEGRVGMLYYICHMFLPMTNSFSYLLF